MRVALVMLATCAVLLVLMANLLLKPKATKKLAAVSAWAANVLGFLLYGYGYAKLEPGILMAILKTIYAVFGMFLGKNAMADMKALPFFSLPWVETLLYLAQLFALYITASAAISAFGAGLLNSLRILSLRRGRLSLFHAVNDHTIRLGNELTAAGEKVVYVHSAGLTADQLTAIRDMRAVHFTDNAALEAQPRFLKRIGLSEKPRNFTVYAIGAAPADNIAFAEKVRASLEALHAPAAGTRLILCADEFFEASSLLNTADTYGYGDVHAFDESELAARVMTLRCPPCETLSFDENARAEEDFDAMIVGFGKTGQAALKSLLENAQFEGSHFRVTVFDPAAADHDGAFRDCCSGLLEAYDITFRPQDGRSGAAFTWLRENASRLNYIVLAMGSKTSSDLGLSYAQILAETKSSARLISCTSSKVTRIRKEGQKILQTEWPLYDRATLGTDAMDRMAMILNHYYCRGNGKTLEENWAACDYFSRVSSAASADFIPSFLRMAGKTEDQVREEGWNLTPAQEENLGRTEHLRWCAFHLAHGYRPMSDTEWQSRADIYLQEKAEKGSSRFRISKNAPGKTHACLVSWEDLPALDQKEAAVTGKFPDYRQLDINNILAIPELLRTKKELESRK